MENGNYYRVQSLGFRVEGWGYIGANGKWKFLYRRVICGLYRDNGQEHGSYYTIGLYRG